MSPLFEWKANNNAKHNSEVFSPSDEERDCTEKKRKTKKKISIATQDSEP